MVLQERTGLQQPQTETNETVEKTCQSERHRNREAPGVYKIVAGSYFNDGPNFERQCRLQEDPFELFISSTKIRYCYYSETHKILGNTFGMCVLQVLADSLAPMS